MKAMTFELRPTDLQPSLDPPRELTAAETAQVAAGTSEPAPPAQTDTGRNIRVDRPFRK